MMLAWTLMAPASARAADSSLDAAITLYMSASYEEALSALSQLPPGADQFDLKLIIVGVGYGYDSVIVRGPPATRSFSVCYLRGGELLAVDSINTPKDQMAARKLIALHARLNIYKLTDPGVPLRDTV